MASSYLRLLEAEWYDEYHTENHEEGDHEEEEVSEVCYCIDADERFCFLPTTIVSDSCVTVSSVNSFSS